MNQLDIKTAEPLVKEQLALLIERETRYQLDDILQEMQTLAENHQIGQAGSPRSPLRNLLVAATDRTASLEIIKNYISYQTARSEDISKILKANYGSKKFGEALIDALDGLENNAEDILDRITEGLTDDSALKKYLTPQVRSREVTDLHLKLTQLYLGYLVREHTALRGSPNSSVAGSEAKSKTASDLKAHFEGSSKPLGSDRPKPKQK